MFGLFARLLVAPVLGAPPGRSGVLPRSGEGAQATAPAFPKEAVTFHIACTSGQTPALDPVPDFPPDRISVRVGCKKKPSGGGKGKGGSGKGNAFSFPPDEIKIHISCDKPKPPPLPVFHFPDFTVVVNIGCEKPEKDLTPEPEKRIVTGSGRRQLHDLAIQSNTTSPHQRPVTPSGRRQLEDLAKKAGIARPRDQRVATGPDVSTTGPTALPGRPAQRARIPKDYVKVSYDPLGQAWYAPPGVPGTLPPPPVKVVVLPDGSVIWGGRVIGHTALPGRPAKKPAGNARRPVQKVDGSFEQALQKTKDLQRQKEALSEKIIDVIHSTTIYNQKEKTKEKARLEKQLAALTRRWREQWKKVENARHKEGAGAWPDRAAVGGAVTSTIAPVGTGEGDLWTYTPSTSSLPQDPLVREQVADSQDPVVVDCTGDSAGQICQKPGWPIPDSGSQWIPGASSGQRMYALAAHSPVHGFCLDRGLAPPQPGPQCYRPLAWDRGFQPEGNPFLYQLLRFKGIDKQIKEFVDAGVFSDIPMDPKRLRLTLSQLYLWHLMDHLSLDMVKEHLEAQVRDARLKVKRREITAMARSLYKAVFTTEQKLAQAHPQWSGLGAPGGRGR